MPSPPTRPATISELATAAAETSSSNSNGDLKNLLRRADGHRRTGGVYMARTTGGSSGTATSTDIGLDLERAFIEYARAATLIVETVPAHREYNTGLNAEQRANLKANGEDILQHLGQLKAALVERYERYMRSGAAREDAVPAFMAAQQLKNPTPTPPPQPTRKASLATHARAAQVVADEAAQWRTQREEAAVRDAGVGYDRMSVASSPAYISSASASAYASSSSASTSASTSNFNPASRTGGYGAGAPTPTYLSSASQSAVAAAARAAAAPMPATVPVSLGRSSSSGTGAGGPAPAALPASFAGASSGGGAYGAYPSSAGVSFPHPQPQRSASLLAASAGSYAGAGGGGGGGKGGSPTSYTSTYNTPSGAASYSSYASTTKPPSSYTSTSTAPSSYTSPTPSNYTSASASTHNTPAPGPMPLRPPFANSAEWEWESGESTDEERCVFSPVLSSPSSLFFWREGGFGGFCGVFVFWREGWRAFFPRVFWGERERFFFVD
ncbi:hypothetical protein B0H13DRAFT_640697 [Mycena leptocephala]|nr:hypothetical protein B0H13DRAFT_640697 [Mycena leptocephala]